MSPAAGHGVDTEEIRAARATGPRNEIDSSTTLKGEYLDPSLKPQASRRRAGASDRIDPFLGCQMRADRNPAMLRRGQLPALRTRDHPC